MVVRTSWKLGRASRGDDCRIDIVLAIVTVWRRGASAKRQHPGAKKAADVSDSAERDGADVGVLLVVRSDLDLTIMFRSSSRV